MTTATDTPDHTVAVGGTLTVNVRIEVKFRGSETWVQTQTLPATLHTLAAAEEYWDAVLADGDPMYHDAEARFIKVTDTVIAHRPPTGTVPTTH